MQPGFEEIRIAKRAQLAPGHDERGLHRILGPVAVAQDPGRDCHASVADRAGEGVEGLSVAPLRAIHERSMHPTLPSLGLGPNGLDHISEGSARAIGSISRFLRSGRSDSIRPWPRTERNASTGS